MGLFSSLSTRFFTCAGIYRLARFSSGARTTGVVWSGCFFGENFDDSDFGSSVIFITHDLGVVAEIADRVMVMYAGRIVERGTTRDLFTQPWHPYTWGLHDSIPPLDGARPDRLPSIPGSPPSLLRLPKGCSFGPRCRFRFEACEQRPELAGSHGHEAACFIPEEECASLRKTGRPNTKDAS